MLAPSPRGSSIAPCTPLPHNSSAQITQAISPNQNTPPDNVMNLSNFTLSASEQKVLQKGLNFCPATGHHNEFQLFWDLENFARTLRLQEFFHGKETEERHPLSNPRQWAPNSQRDKYLDLYIESVQRDILKSFKDPKKFRQNISKDERAAMKALSERTDIIIKPADKGGAVVVLNKTDYLEEGMRQLNDRSFYKPLDTDPTDEYKAILKNTLQQLNQTKMLDDRTFRALISLHPRPGTFYTLPKIHKPNNPGRPIISGIGTVTENLSSYVDSLIKEIPKSFDSYIKDTNHFLNLITDINVPANSFLVTLDVASLYTNIPHADGINSTVSMYESQISDKPIDGNTLSILLRLILELNNFEFNDNHYVQVSGTSMGTKIGPNYANIFMGVLESRFLSNQTMSPILCKRYIDDIFMIWTHSETELLKFIDTFNEAHKSIRFSRSYSQNSINFLDVTVTINGSSLETNLYRKPTDRQQLLHFSSSHPQHCKTSIPYSQAHRYRRICSNERDFISNTDALRNTLSEQKYPKQVIDDAINRAQNLNGEEILSRHDTDSTKVRETNLVLNFSANLPNINGILRRQYNILEQSDHMKEVIPKVPRAVFRRAKNLGDIITSSRLTSPKNNGSGPCNKPRCKICPHMVPTSKATSSKSNFVYNIEGTFNCDSQNIVYLLHCTLCSMQYIGQTETPFRLRFNNHRAHIKSIPDLPFSRHMRLPEHSIQNITVIILQSGFQTHYDREATESYLIHKFNTLSDGINENRGKWSVTALSKP
ncbi:unnamed protein product [Ixodes hexagonus]